MIDLASSMAFAKLVLAIDSSPGAYTVLAGTGVSRDAGVPTAWDVMADLIGRVAAAKGANVDQAHRETWWVNTYGESPRYSSVLAELAPSPLARRNLLKPYFEPPDPELPNEFLSLTHDAIARLVAKGKVRCIITTNFDRLFEHAFERWHVHARIITNVDRDGIAIFDTTPVVFKVNGDYLDLATRNTEAELRDYSVETRDILRMIIANSGLIIAGWSALWDKALRELLIKTPSRFPTYWAAVGDLSVQAQKVIAVRGAEVIPCYSSDQLFTTLESAVDALAERGFAKDDVTSVSDLGPLRKLVVENQSVFCRVGNRGTSLEWHESYTAVAVADGTSTQFITFFWPRPEEVELELLAGGRIVDGPVVSATGAIVYTVELPRTLQRRDRHVVSFVRRVRSAAEPMPPYIGWSPQAPTRSLTLAVQFDESSIPADLHQVVGPAGNWPSGVAVGTPMTTADGYVERAFKSPMKGFGYGLIWKWQAAPTDELSSGEPT